MSHFVNEAIYEDIYFDILDTKLKDFINLKDMDTTNSFFDMIEVLQNSIKLPNQFIFFFYWFQTCVLLTPSQER